MIYMDVDMHTHSFQAVRQVSSKRSRSRSPDTDYLERPSKRITLSINSSDVGYPKSRHTTRSVSSRSSSRNTSEDWVLQTNSLTIESPTTFVSTLYEDDTRSRDGDVSMEPDENTDGRQDKLRLSHLQTSYIHPTLSSNPHPQNFLMVPGFEPPYPLTKLEIKPPSINILPPTPMTPLSHKGFPLTRPITPPPESPSAMVISPTITSPRKQRFSMGPRSDCVKCRLGVKGHSVHLD